MYLGEIFCPALGQIMIMTKKVKQVKEIKLVLENLFPNSKPYITEKEVCIYAQDNEIKAIKKLLKSYFSNVMFVESEFHKMGEKNRGTISHRHKSSDGWFYENNCLIFKVR
jgi:hypothetical protein